MKETIVVKVGGNVLGNINGIAGDIKELLADGYQIAIVHGGGNKIDRALLKAGVSPYRIDGLRVTDAETMAVVTSVLDKANAELVSTLNSAGVPAVSFQSQQIILQGKQIEELGFVGTVQSVDAAPLQSAFAAGLLPVIAPFGATIDGTALNINADEAAVAVAAALGACKLLYLSDVPGVLADADNSDSLLAQISVAQCEDLISEKVATGGMVPKLQTAISAIARGVGSVNILDGLAPHAMLRACQPADQIGTLIVP